KMAENRISNIDAVSELNKLTSLDLNHNDISSMKPIANLKKLDYLNLSNNQIKSIPAGISNLKALYTLVLDDNQITNISTLMDLPNLVYLSLNSNQISEINSLERLPLLQSLLLSGNQISKVDNTSVLPSVKYLYLDYTNLSSIQSLEAFPIIENISANNNPLTNITGLSNSPTLTYLNLRGNQIKDISPMASLSNLKSLYLDSNQISDITPLSNLKHLTLLWLSNNQISDISPIDSLTELANISLVDQQITKDIALYQTSFTLANNIKDTTGGIVPPLTMSDNGTYANSNITWNLPSYTEKVSYTFNQSVTIGSDTEYFSGTVTQPLQNKPISYKVIFDVDGAKTSTTAEASTLITEPAEPTKEGYTFIGWYDAKTGGNKWDFSTDKMPANNLTLYAQFTKQTNPDQGNGSDSTPTPNDGSSATPGNTNHSTPVLQVNEGKGSANTAQVDLPKTGDESNALLVILGVLCIGMAIFFGFRRTQVKYK
ncbi:leucine-rich repeat domain-containing protein, partial [Listeria monocytogenes]|nr:leucine-rich repeat domain-containing protein [Listeria monocytogenes]